MEGNSLPIIGHPEENISSTCRRREAKTLMESVDGREIPMADLDLCVCTGRGGNSEVEASEAGGLGRWLNG